MGGKRKYTWMCNWVPIFYSGEKSMFGEITLKNKLKQTKTAEYTWFSSTHGTFPKRDHLLGHYTYITNLKNSNHSVSTLRLE